ncbi:CehA/McbA family metallohydrolase [Nannocystis sp.]|uniref:CehA/McbA family metallohydrolase n=1 Tax=Nannocystis sp. TaxID=1962667 RepID=UPI0025F4B41F|nr:CehA/McbA family metallohydrolase [Nannocystis sp.]MBK7827741.1 PHP domain-containing protein [Nannocystis sp.]
MRLLTLLCGSLLATPALAGETKIVLDGAVPDGGLDHFFVPFDVPPGTVEIEVQHDDLSDANILDWGLNDPAGFRGWGGGNSEPAVVGLAAASRSYVAGPIAAGEWRVVVGKAKLVETPASYALTVILRDAPSLAPQPERAPYQPFAGLGGGPRWYAGDFHVHSRESGDAKPPLAEIAALARSRGLDFVEISDHNTLTQLEFFAAAQAEQSELLFVPGSEFTTYAGHANAIGATAWVDHKIGQPGVTIAAAAAAYAAQGALFSINHPALDLGDVCIGCAWKHEIPAELAAVEVATGGLDKAGKYLTDDSIAFWDKLCGEGRHLAAIGGSDDHRAGKDLGAFDSPVGDPTTMIYADELSTPALLAGITAGRTVVKLQGPGDPMLELAADVSPIGDTITADAVTLQATVTGAPAGSSVRFLRNGQGMPPIPIDDDPFVASVQATAPATGEDRWRAEVIVDGQPRTITSHLWLRDDPSSAPTTGPEPTTGLDASSGSTAAPTGGAPGSSSSGSPEETPGETGGCACDLKKRPSAPMLLALLVLIRRRRD